MCGSRRLEVVNGDGRVEGFDADLFERGRRVVGQGQEVAFVEVAFVEVAFVEVARREPVVADEERVVRGGRDLFDMM